MASTTATVAGPLTKRRIRAGKPKVKTGCITCESGYEGSALPPSNTNHRIRRIKCDEAKPACLRCTSTGRKCDGYDINANPRSRKNDATANALSHRYQIATPPAASLEFSIPRPLLADIMGTDMERFYFHCFRAVAGEAVGIRHKYNSMFWKETVPQHCYEVESIKHAFIAFGAAYHNFQTTGERADPTAPPSRTERFIIQQYSLAMRGLAQDTQQVSVRRRYGMTLISCIAFFCIEMLRNDWRAALTHLSNGLHLMANLPEEVSDILNNPEKWSRGPKNQHARVLYMLRLLSRWEVAMRLVTGDFQPRLTLRIYESRKLDASAGTKFASVEDIYEAVDSYCQDASAFTWLTRDHHGDTQFWAQHRPKLQRSVLMERSRLISNNICIYQNNFDMEHLEFQDVVFFNASRLRHKGATLILEMLPLPEKANEPLELDELRQFEDFIRTAIQLRDIITSSATRRPVGDNANVDLAVVPTLYVTGSNCREEGLRKKILGLAMEWPRRENLWDGPALRHMLDIDGIRSSKVRELMMEPKSETMQWNGGLPSMWF
ncbi:Zn(2)-C6 fungal-type DNA-binding domain protein [Metarhizium rileyi]|uniref:Zn(2)-C6 fungal-type DNA-binding domain protein n=1 Tax=Metarhizium rileyi (strain RCEF 4871) TaxID=1649241 RepID=A0A167H760_METRR|nr:Zn(2)-C6 fungal-type DNA-binding domain protein [Metarhizium rileyi RCEF 4871]